MKIEEKGVKVWLVLEVVVEGVRTEEEYVLAVYLDKGLLTGKCENEELVGEHATAAFLFDPGVGVGEGQFDEVEVAGWGTPPVPV